jgi:hypothetical protein
MVRAPFSAFPAISRELQTVPIGMRLVLACPKTIPMHGAWRSWKNA